MIVVIGDVLVDILVLPDLQKAEQPEGLAIRSGGSAANTAAWIAWLGTSSTFVGCVGDDGPGKMLVDELQLQGVRTAVRRVEDRASGAVLVQVSPDGERLMKSSRGANQELSPTDLASLPLKNWSAVHMSGYALLGKSGLDMLAAASALAKKTSAILSFDPSSESVVESIGVKSLRAALTQSGVDLLLPNACEARALTGKTLLEEAAADLLAVAPRVLLKNRSGPAIAASCGALHSVPTTALDAVDTTGAGDAFDAGALVALAMGTDLDNACIGGHTTAGLAITYWGGRPLPGTFFSPNYSQSGEGE
ncbi:MAG: carbohydrate kinase family protein [Chloroflexota bacterium]|nr:MAG: carbohydrate kinase [Chloroflexota bacterium]